MTFTYDDGRPYRHGRIILPDGSSEPMPELEARSPARLKQLQDAVGGYIELISGHSLGGNLAMIVNEEGLLKGLEMNQIASMLAGRIIVGPAVIFPMASLENT